MRWLVGGIAGLLTAAFVGLAAVGGVLYWDRVETRGEQTARDELGPLAQKQIPAVFNYDYKTVERSLTDAYKMLTPDYRREFEDRANSDIIPQARQRDQHNCIAGRDDPSRLPAHDATRCVPFESSRARRC